MGSFLPRPQDCCIMDIVRKQVFYKCFGIKGNKICNSDFYSNACISSIRTSLTKQCSCPFIFSKDGRYPQQSTLRYKQKDLGLLAGQRDHNYSRMPSRCFKQESQFPVANKVGSQSFPKNMREVGGSRHRSFCFQNFSSGPNIHIMEVGSIQQGKEAFQITWTHLKGNAFSLLQ